LKTDASATVDQRQEQGAVEMRSIKMVIGLAAAACLLAVVAAPAMAQPQWYECLEVTEGTGKYEDNHCSKEGGKKNWEWIQLSKALESVSEGELEFEDSKTAVGAVRLKCKVKSTGTVGPHEKDTIETAEVTGCKVVKGTCGSPTVKPVHLPWNTELTEAGGEIRDKIKNSGAGLPGYTSTCVVIIKITDTCEGETSAGTANNLTEGLVEVKFDKISEKATCTQSKEKTGTVEGTLTVKAKNGQWIARK
jgi:hypothetical protein